MKKIAFLLTLLLLTYFGTIHAQDNPMHGWHTYCTSEFADAISYGTSTTIATCYPPDMASNFAGTQITKVAMFSDSLLNAVGGIYTCSIYMGGETPSEGVIVYTMGCDVPQGLNDWAEFDLSTPIWVTGDETIWIVWQAEQPLTPYPMGVCSDIDPSGNGNWAWNGSEWEHLGYLTNGDWTVKTYFNWDGPQPQPQDVYVSGNHFTTGKVLKNNTLLYSITDSINVQLKGIQVAEDGTVYGAGSAFNNSAIHGCVWMNDSCIFTADTNTYFDHIALNGNNWTVAGFNNVWQNGELLYSYSHEEDECHIHSLAVDTTMGDIYAGGVISFNSDSLFHACVWKNDTVLWLEDTISSVQSICFDGENLFAAGFMVANDSLSYGVIWQNDSIIYQMENANFGHIAAFDGSLYWTGISMTDTVVCIWQDGEVLYALPELSGINNLVVNENGVYYTDAQTVYKDGEILYQPEECIITGLVVKPAPPIPTFTLTVEASNPDWGTVIGGGEYHYGDTATIEAISNMGCEFLYWNDSVTDNPREVIVLSDSTFIAHFGLIGYLIETSASPENGGFVTEGGLYHYGDTLTLEAIPNDGYAFICWSDSITSNPLDVIVLSDSTFTAYFALEEYHIETTVLPEGAGTVSGGGTYHYGDTVELVATPNLGFEFTNWSDGSTHNPRIIVVTESQTYTANFGIQQCLIETAVSPEGAGLVSGGGVYNYGSTIQLVAHNNIGFVFSQWDDGILENPRSVFVEGDALYTAVFTPLEYEITTHSNPEEGGTVSGGGIYHYGDTALLKASPNLDFIFLCWSDGSPSNPRTVIVTRDAEYTAMFYQNAPQNYTITVTANDTLLGTVSGDGVYPEGTIIPISATPNENAYFKQWNDGDTTNPRFVEVKQDSTFTAFFVEKEIYYTITVASANPLMGSVYGSGEYKANTVISIGATPHIGFQFSSWQDGNTDNPRTITVTADATFTANFEMKPTQMYTITAYFDETQGFVIGAGTYEEGSTATLAAIPADDYIFVKWSDESTENPREILVNQDIVLAAFFHANGVDEYGNAIIHPYPNPANDCIFIDGLEAGCVISIFDARGTLVKTLEFNGNTSIPVGDLAQGLYLLRVGTQSFKFLKH